MTWGTPVQSFVFLGLLVFELEPMYETSDRRTDTDDRLMPRPPMGWGHKNDYGIVGSNIPLDILQVILGTILRVRYPTNSVIALKDNGIAVS